MCLGNGRCTHERSDLLHALRRRERGLGALLPAMRQSPPRSGGREGQSDIREVALETGKVKKATPIAPREFGEGLAIIGDRAYQLTWRGGRGHVYNAQTLAPIDSFAFEGEGWGLTSNGKTLLMTDGSSNVREIDPNGFKTLRTFQVTEAGKPVHFLNELEIVRGELWANIYQTDLIARIDPSTGKVVGWIDVSKLLSDAEKTDVAQRGGTANGIAFDPVRNRVLVTGKLWPRVFEIEIANKPR